MRKEFEQGGMESAVDRVFESMSLDFSRMCEKAARELEPYCESPIELMLGSCFLVLSRTIEYRDGDKPFFRLLLDGDECGDDALIYFTPQYEWKGYRIDFAIQRQTSPTLIFIECDGHDFHERTADQAEHDRGKDRKIQEAGIPILRFTGREIYRSPKNCVTDILQFIMNRQEGT